MKLKKLPIGIQTFSKIVEDNHVYIDKTEIAYNLIKKGTYYFLSRPRRFGKSLFLDTLKNIFQGNKDLFKGLYIHNKWDFTTTYPVIKISFGAGVHNETNGLDKTLRYRLKDIAEDYNIECENLEDTRECFAILIKSIYKKYNQKVVILIDEYDKPILDNITNTTLAKEMRDKLKNFYSVIKDSDEYIKFVFITGVSKFSKVNLFSGLNNLEDITLNPSYGTICGYTHEDIKTTFKEHLENVDLNLLKEWYNGYNYFSDKVYNPFDILLFISNGKDYRNYWWSTGNPSFLIELLKKREYFIPDIANFEANDALLDSFDVEHINLIALLWQTGYLTIKEKFTSVRGGVKYKLTIPNKEIRLSFNDFLIDYLTQERSQKFSYQDDLYEVLSSADMEGFEKTLKILFASIPYHNFTNNEIQNYEGYYASVMYAYLASLGQEIITEDSTNRSRIDLTLKFPNKIYIFEFKVVDASEGKSLEQIKEKKYYEKYQGFDEIYLVGIEFCKVERNVCGIFWERVSSL